MRRRHDKRPLVVQRQLCAQRRAKHDGVGALAEARAGIYPQKRRKGKRGKKKKKKKK